MTDSDGRPAGRTWAPVLQLWSRKLHLSSQARFEPCRWFRYSTAGSGQPELVLTRSVVMGPAAVGAPRPERAPPSGLGVPQ
jgi:hypothetical protein